MGLNASITLGIEKREVVLRSPGSEGVRFHDAVLVLRNEGAECEEGLALHFRGLEGQATLFDGVVKFSEMGLADSLEAGETLGVGVFSILQRYARGFASKVNLFGYRATLNWEYEVSAAVVKDGRTDEPAELHSWFVRWPDPGPDKSVVEVEIS